MARPWRKSRIVPDQVRFKEFAGIINTRSSKDIGFEGLTTATNVVLSDTKKIARRPGFSTYYSSSTVESAYVVDDKLYVVDDGTLYRLAPPTPPVLLMAGLTGTDYSWESYNGLGYFVNGIDAGIIKGNTCVSWRETVAESESPSVGDAQRVISAYAAGDSSGAVIENEALDLTPRHLDGLPSGVSVIAVYKGRMYCAEWSPADSLTVIWASQPFAFKLFDKEKDFLTVSGRVVFMKWANQGLLIGTTERIYMYDIDRGLEELADYGAVPGAACDTDSSGVAYFWTTRGICKAMPFENLTEKNVAMPPGSYATAQLVYLNGMMQFITVTQGGGEPFNNRSLS